MDLLGAIPKQRHRHLPADKGTVEEQKDGERAGTDHRPPPAQIPCIWPDPGRASGPWEPSPALPLPSCAFLPHKRQSSMSGHATERTCEGKRPVSGLQGALCCCLEQVSRKIMRNIWHIWKSYSPLLLPPQPQAGHHCVQSVKLAPETAAEKSEKHQERRP